MDWAEDDVWDSASDSESPRHSTIAHSWRYSSNTQPKRQPSFVTAPKPVPKAPTNSSSSTLAQSYTHLNPPSPSSYPPKPESGQAASAKGGWTMVRKSSISQISTDGTASKSSDLHRDTDVDGGIVVGDFDPEIVESGTANKFRQEQGSIKSDAEEIMNGIDKSLLLRHALTSKRIDPFRRILRSPTPRASPPQASLSSGDGVGPSHRAGDAGKHSRESSIRSNRRSKFIDCLSKEDLNISEWLVLVLNCDLVQRCSCS